jgi:hypothetical protein
MTQAKWFEGTPLLSQRDKSGSVSGFAHTKWGLSLLQKGAVPILYTMPAQPSNGLLTTLPSPGQKCHAFEKGDSFLFF